MEYRQCIIIGGGIAGLTLAYLLAKKGREVCLIERNDFPRHKVCGEYVSNEVLPFLTSEGLLSSDLDLPKMDTFQLSDTAGNQVELPLDLGGFGISRYYLDHLLFEKAREAGAEIRTGENVLNLRFEKDTFIIETASTTFKCIWAIGAFGKRSVLDRILARPFMKNRSPYLGVKYHVKNSQLKQNIVSLHNFRGGYFGINAVENTIINFCYLAHRQVLRDGWDLQTMEDQVIKQNPRIREAIETSEFLWEKPEVINEISFETKSPVDSHILMCGDAAGMITPLCGNGMAIAFHSAKLLSSVLLSVNPDDPTKRERVEQDYQATWNAHFSRRLKTGRYVQKLFGQGNLSTIAVNVGHRAPLIANWIMSHTHGTPFS